MATLQSQEGPRMESLPHHVVERIMERLPVSSLLMFKTVSKQWKSTIVSTSFQERQLMQRQQSGDPDVLMVSVCHGPYDIESLKTLVLGSSSSVKIPTPWENKYYLVPNASCDGLVCLYHSNEPVLLVNPTTRWYRRLPLCQLQELFISLHEEFYKFRHPNSGLGFGKDKFMGTYKVVWLYYANDKCLGRTITCEVFYFITNAWRNVSPTAPYGTNGDPAYIDGSLHWFTICEESKILSFDLHTEAFQVLCSAPFANDNAYKTVDMCNLNNRLCVSEITWPNQVIWSFDSRGNFSFVWSTSPMRAHTSSTF